MRAELAGREVSVLLDGVGGEFGRGALELLGIAGRVIMFGWSAGARSRCPRKSCTRAASPSR